MLLGSNSVEESSMSEALVIEEINADGRRPIGSLAGDEVLVGRDKSCNLVLSSGGVSWQHGVFTRVRDHWLYKDLGSTNGSWLNGVQVQEGHWALIRPGDIMQLADIALRFAEKEDAVGRGGRMQGFPQLGMKSLLVFARDAFAEEYPIPEYGRALVIGGSKADLKLDVDVHELPSLVIERRGERVCAFGIAKEVSIYRNGEEITSLVNLADRDEVSVGHYSVIYNDPAASAINSQDAGKIAIPERSAMRQEWVKPGGRSEMAPSRPDQRGAEGWLKPVGGVGEGPTVSLRNYPDERPLGRSNVSLPFGKVSQEDELGGVDETVALDAAEVREKIAGYDMHPSMRYAMPESERQGFSFEVLEDKVMILVVLLLMLLMMAFLVWFVFLA